MNRTRLLLLSMRLLWLATVPLSLGLFAAGLLLKLQQEPIGTAERQIRHGMALATWDSTLLDLLLIAGFALLAGLLVWRRRDDWFAVFVSMALILVPVRLPTEYALLSETYPSLYWIVGFISVLGATCIPLLLSLFPDGHFVPRRSWLYVLAGLTYSTVAYFVPAYTTIRFTVVGFLIDALMVGAGIAAQIYRYRHVATPLQRQQCKWVLGGFSVAFAGFYTAELPLVVGATVWPELIGGWLYSLLPQLIANLTLLMVPVTITISILRYHLWHVDVLIRRTLTYSVLTMALAAIYATSVVVLQQTIFWITGQRASELVIVISTLAVAALFSPLRHRIQRTIDRRFYRRKYDAVKTLAAFSAIARDEVDLEKLRESIIQVVEETVQPAQLALWLAAPEQRGPVDRLPRQP